MPDPEFTPTPVPPEGASVRPLRPKPQVPDHELIRCIGSGGYGEVWLAKNVVGTYRAAKVVYLNSFKDARPYEREYRGIQKFEPISRSNDGFVDILQIGRNDEAGHFYYVMELADDVRAVQGSRFEVQAPEPRVSDQQFNSYSPKTLGTEIQQRGRLPFAECLQSALTLTLALGHLHRHGLIHRDIKPSNIIFVGGIPKLADIGLVAELEQARSFVGTEGFMAPEGPNSAQADIYSLGKVLYEMSMGKDRLDFPEPFTALGQATGSPELEELNTVILKACAPNPRDRYQSAEELHVDLALLQNGKSVKWKRVVEKRLAFARNAGVIVGLIAALAVGGYLYQRHQTREAKRLQRHAEDLAAQAQIQNAEYLFQRGQSALALANLAAVLRRQPDNRVAAERIIAALLQRNFPRLSTPPLQHPAGVIAARFSPDGETIVSGTSDRSIHFWNTRTGEEIRPGLRHAAPIYDVEFSSNGLMVAVTLTDGSVLVLNARTGAPIFAPLSHQGEVYAAKFDPSGRVLATACADSNVRLFSMETGQLLYPPLPHDGPVASISFSPDGKRLASGSQTGALQIWEVDTGNCCHEFKVAGRIVLVRLSPDAKLLATAFQETSSASWRLQVWDLVAQKPLTDPLLHGRIYSVNFSPDGQRLVVAASGGARVWELASGKNLFRLNHREAVYAATFGPDGSKILTASVDQSARLWDASTGNAISEPYLHGERVIHAEFNSAGNKVLTASWDKTVKVWQVRSAPSPPKSLPHNTWLKSADFDAEGRQIITATGQTVYTASRINAWEPSMDQFVGVWTAATGALVRTSAIPEGTEALIAQFTQQGARALIVSRALSNEQGWRVESGFSNTGQVWDAEQQAAIGPALQHQSDIRCAQFSPDGRNVAIGLNDGSVHFWEIETGVERSHRSIHKRPVNSLRFDNAGTLLVSTSADHTAVIWDAKSGEAVGPPLPHQSAVWFAQFSPIGDKVLTLGDDNLVRIWSTNGKLIRSIEDAGPIEYAEFSPDSTKLVTACSDGRARLWDTATGLLLAELEHSSLIMIARFSPDGLRVLTVSKDETAQLWDATGLKLADPFSHDGWVVSGAFSPDGRNAVTASLDRTVKIWKIPIAETPIPAWLPELAEAVGGQRLTAARVSERVPWTNYVNLKHRLKSERQTDDSEFLDRVFAEP